jgi:hypothetical protein
MCTLCDPIECTLSMYVDYVLFWSDDGCVANETCCLDDNYRVLYSYWYTISCVLYGKKSATNYYSLTVWLASDYAIPTHIYTLWSI